VVNHATHDDHDGERLASGHGPERLPRREIRPVAGIRDGSGDAVEGSGGPDGSPSKTT
jgi:hypothetical protein